MQPWGKVSSIPGANTIFQGQQNKGRSAREIKRGHREEQGRDEKTYKQRREIQKREREERSKTQIKEDPSSRSKEEPGSLRDTTSEGRSTL
jgi:hypothetical protein